MQPLKTMVRQMLAAFLWSFEEDFSALTQAKIQNSNDSHNWGMHTQACSFSKRGKLSCCENKLYKAWWRGFKDQRWRAELTVHFLSQHHTYLLGPYLKAINFIAWNRQAVRNMFPVGPRPSSTSIMLFYVNVCMWPFTSKVYSNAWYLAKCHSPKGQHIFVLIILHGNWNGHILTWEK